MQGKVSFFNQGTSYRLLGRTVIKHWIIEVILRDAKIPGDISIIFCDDAYLSELNRTYLSHSSLTDIITFDYTSDGIISGDIYISIDRVKENALLYSKSFREELDRVMIHGILHLLGNKDKKPKDKALMRKKENDCLDFL